MRVSAVLAFVWAFASANSLAVIASLDPTDPYESLYTSTVSSSNVNYIVGAERFYTAGYSGANAEMSNIEAGHINNTYTYLTHVTTQVHGGGALGTAQSHATNVGHIMGGRPLGHIAGQGIAPNATLYSGAIATSISGGSFSLSFDSMVYAYTNSVIGFGAVDVINSSWGGTDATGTGIITLILDGLADQNPNTTFVMAAGNSGSGANTVLGPASGYNGISVGALTGANSYQTIAGFSSRGPQHYSDPVNGTVNSVRAPVDITAPGAQLFAGQGTSYAAPAVAGAVALMADAARGEGLPATAHDARVVKVNLLNAATKVPGWSNGQSAHPNGNGGVRTTQALDYTYGTGAMNLDRTYDQYLTGQTDIAGVIGGTTSQAIGWDFAEVQLGLSTDIVINHLLAGGSEFRATLTWFRDRMIDFDAGLVLDNAFADLNLQIWNSNFTTLYSESVSPYNESEHVAFALPTTGYYGIRVAYAANRFDLVGLTSEEFAVAWWGVSADIVPEPSIGLLLLTGAFWLLRRRR